MNKKSRLFSIAIVGTSVVLAGFVAQTYHSDLSVSETNIGVQKVMPKLLPNHEQNLQENLSKQMLANKDEINQLKQTLKRLEKTLDQLALAQKNAQYDNFQPNAPEEDIMTGITEEETFEDKGFAEHFANYMTDEGIHSEDDQESNSIIEQSFDAELEAEEITGVHLYNTECKETLCKIELGFDDEAILDEYADIVSWIVPWDGPVFFHPQESELNTLVYYVPKEGYKLPLPESFGDQTMLNDPL